MGVWQNDRVEIIANDQGNRTTPSYVAFTDTERLIGDAAKNQVSRQHLHCQWPSQLLRPACLISSVPWHVSLGTTHFNGPIVTAINRPSELGASSRQLLGRKLPDPLPVSLLETNSYGRFCHLQRCSC